MVSGKPCLMHHSRPGEMRSFTLSMFWSVILSPGATSARAPPTTEMANPIAIASLAPLVIVFALRSAKTDGAARGLAWRPRRWVAKRLSPSVSCVHERRDREPVVGDARLLALVEVPALLAREARARQRRLGRVLELHVDHHDRRDEAHLVGVFGGVRAVERLPPVAHVVDPDLPELARPIV